jgi:hypothetical protein
VRVRVAVAVAVGVKCVVDLRFVWHVACGMVASAASAVYCVLRSAGCGCGFVFVVSGLWLIRVRVFLVLDN